MQAGSRPALREQLGAFQIADPHACGPAIAEADHGVLQMRFQRNAVLEQRTPHAIQQQPGICAKPQHGGGVPVQAMDAVRTQRSGGHAVALRIAGEQCGRYLRAPACTLCSGGRLPIQDAEALGQRTRSQRIYCGQCRVELGDIQRGGGRLQHHVEAGHLRGQGLPARCQQVGQRHRAFQLIPGVLAHAVGQAHMHRALEEIRQRRVVQRAHRRGGPQGLAQHAHGCDRAACLQFLQQWIIAQALYFPRVAGVEIVVAAELLQGGTHIAALHAQQAPVDAEPVQRKRRTCFRCAGQDLRQRHTFAAFGRGVQCVAP